MNLHIVPDNIFINKFYENLSELTIAGNNKIVVRTNNRELKYVRHDLPFARLYTREFDALTGDTRSYSSVFIHQFTPLLYRWVASNLFNELNWMVWGADIYNLPSLHMALYEKLTLNKYVKGNFSLKDFLYRTKVSLLHERFRERAYAKVSNVLTWMPSEYDFALRHLPALKAAQRFFFYENDLRYQALDELITQDGPPKSEKQPLYILGNSATAELNHLDVLAWMDSESVKADLCVPLSYGDRKYARFLKKNLSFYRGGSLSFIDDYMPFTEYLHLLHNADGLIMNNIRPQGYGNIFMMMYLGKRVYLNEKNLSIPELNRGGLIWQPVEKLSAQDQLNWKQNRPAVRGLLSHSLLLSTYRQLFS